MASAMIFDDVVIMGAVTSCTVTANLAEPVLPAASLAVHVTMVEVMANVELDAGVHVGPTVTPTSSVAVGAV